VVGPPDLESLTTSHIERVFLKVRQEGKLIRNSVHHGSFHAHFTAVQAYAVESVALQIGKVRDEIRLNGFSVVGCADLDFLCEGHASEEKRTEWLRQIGEWEGWTVEWQADGKVRLSTLAISADGSFRTRSKFSHAPWGD